MAILTISLAGYLFDSFMSYSNYYSINAKVNFLFLPIWFLTLWPSFSILLLSLSTFIRSRKIISAFIAGLIGPLTYYAGTSMNLANVSGYSIFILISIFWFFLVYFYAKYYSEKADC